MSNHWINEEEYAKKHGYKDFTIGGLSGITALKNRASNNDLYLETEDLFWRCSDEDITPICEECKEVETSTNPRLCLDCQMNNGYIDTQFIRNFYRRKLTLIYREELLSLNDHGRWFFKKDSKHHNNVPDLVMLQPYDHVLNGNHDDFYCDENVKLGEALAESLCTRDIKCVFDIHSVYAEGQTVSFLFTRNQDFSLFEKEPNDRMIPAKKFLSTQTGLEVRDYE